MPCENFDGWLVGRKPGQIVIGKTRCGMWTCGYCAKKNQEIWQAKIINGINLLKKPEWSFITLTAHENATNYVMSMKNIQNGWKTLQTRIRRKIKDEGKENSFSYARVYEQHKDGRVHWHMVCSWVPVDYKEPKKKTDKGSRWISDNARECGLGYQTKTLKIEGHGGYVASYVVKYLTKVENEWPKGTRLVQTSRDWPKSEISEKSEYTWKTQREITEYDLSVWFRRGDEIYDINTREDVTYDRINEYGYYVQSEQESDLS